MDIINGRKKCWQYSLVVMLNKHTQLACCVLYFLRKGDALTVLVCVCMYVCVCVCVYIYIYIYIYICTHTLSPIALICSLVCESVYLSSTDCFVVSPLFSVARHKSSWWHTPRPSLHPNSQRQLGNWCIYIKFCLFTFCAIGYWTSQFVRIALHYASGDC